MILMTGIYNRKNTSCEEEQKKEKRYSENVDICQRNELGDTLETKQKEERKEYLSLYILLVT